MQNKDIQDLIHDERFCNYCLNANADDVAYWENWLADHPAERSAVEKQKMIVLLLAHETAEQVTEQEFKKLQQKIKKSNSRRPAYFSLVVRWSVAATVLLTCGLSWYFYKKGQPVEETAKNSLPKASSGSDRASLMLANGRTILLSDTMNEKLAVQSGVVISNNAHGQLVYTAVDKNGSSGAVSYNTLRTPSGSQYQVILPDGSHVWLNALSTLKYPARFAGGKREVSITGEGYFEVTHNAKMPFFVNSRQQRIEVIGTHFNISCYDDDPAVRTTLLEGKVLVTAGADSGKLTPGQTLTLQQQREGASRMQVRNDPDPEGAVAWKNGMLHFHKADIQEIIRVFRRWYNADIEYRGKPGKRLFSGDIPKDQPLSVALKILSYKDIKITSQGRKIIIEERR